MERDELHRWRVWDFIVNVLLIGVTLLTLASVAWSFDAESIIVEWTPDGKQLGMPRVVECRAQDEMAPVRTVPAH